MYATAYKSECLDGDSTRVTFELTLKLSFGLLLANNKITYGQSSTLIETLIAVFLNLESIKVFYGQEPPSGESTTNVRGVNYQILSVMLLK